jgi:indole-3-glycerol phosphate synthase
MIVLNQIISNTREELEHRKYDLPLSELQKIAEKQPAPLDFASALQGNEIRLIAEVKKASPSRGIIRADFNPVEIARIYADNGASAISVLTEAKYFQGSLAYLKEIQLALKGKRLPLLRKDFIVDPYQVFESRAYGADSLLLIVAILKPEELEEMLELSHALDMMCLVEVHNEPELEIALKSGASIIGINNRDLNTFKVDLATTERLRPLIPPDRIVVSESGIKTREDIEKLIQMDIDAVLIGESIVSEQDIAAKIKELL